MKRVIILLFIICLFVLVSFFLKSNENSTVSNESGIIDYDTYSTEEYYGYLKIPSVNMNLGFYNYNHELNDVSQNVQYIPIPVSDSYLLVAHSGVGKIAFFNDLHYVGIGDDVYLEIKKVNRHYKITDIYRTVKDGDISISKESGKLYLTTCDQVVKGYQLVIVATQV